MNKNEIKKILQSLHHKPGSKELRKMKQMISIADLPKDESDLYHLIEQYYVGII